MTDRRKRRKKPAHGGKTVGTVADPRGSRIPVLGPARAGAGAGNRGGSLGRRRTTGSAGREAEADRSRSSRAGEGVLVGGRRPDPVDAVTFDEVTAEAGSGVRSRGPRPDGALATWGVRGGAARSARGRQGRGREGRRGGAFDRGSTRTARCSNGRRSGLRPGAADRGCREAEAGGSPSSEAPPDDAFVDGRARREPSSACDGGSVPSGRSQGRETLRSGSRCGRESDGMQGARVECWLQKSERRIFPDATALRGNPRA
jgi:hypothetical protein